RIADASGTRTSTFDLTSDVAGNTWANVGTMTITPGQGHFVEFDNATQSNIGTSTNSRMNASAVRFERAVSSGNPKEPKPPVTDEGDDSIMEVIVDSHPQALDYDDASSSEDVVANTDWGTSTLAGYYDANA